MVFCLVGSTDDDSNHLFDVPLLSWVFVGLGLTFSFALLAKPVWWDRYNNTLISVIPPDNVISSL